MIWRTAALLAAFAWAAAATADEMPFKPIPAYSPEAEAVRQAAALRRRGEQFHEQGRAEEAREAWQSAIEAYRRAGYRAGESEVFFQIAVSYQPELMAKPEAMVGMLDAMAKGATALTEFLEGLAREAGPEGSTPDAEAEALLGRASTLAQAGDCARAVPLYEAAGQRSAAAGSGIGELRAFAGRLRCQQPKEGDLIGAMGFLMILPDFMRIAQELQGKLKAGPAVRFLRAVESAELGRLQEAETLLRALLSELEASGDSGGASRAALDLGCVLIQGGKLAEAETLLRRAREELAGRKDPDSQRNYAAAEKNLADLASATSEVLEHQPVAALPPEPETGVVPAPQQGSEILAEPALAEPAGLSPRARARREAVFLLGEGDRLQKVGQMKEAREKWQAAADAFRRGEDPLGMADAYRRLGDSYAVSSVSDVSKRWMFLDYYLKMMSAAADAHESSVRKELPLDEQALTQADALRQQATSLSESGACAQALSLLEEARRFYQRAGLAVGEARSLMLRTACLARAGDYLAASMAAFEVVSIVESLPLGSPSSELSAKADDLFKQGRWREAREAYQELVCRHERAKEPVGLADALLGQSKVQIALGNYSDAEVSLQRALGLLPFVDEADGESSAARAHQRLAKVYFATGRLDEGVAEFRKARDLWWRTGQPAREVDCLRELGNGLAESGEYAAALSVFREAEELLRRLPSDPEVEGDLLSLKAWIDFRQGKLQDALGLLYKMEDLYRQGGLSAKAAAALFTIAGIQDFLGRHDEALEISRRLGDRQRQDDSGVLKQLVSLITLVNLMRQEKYQEASELGLQILPFWEQHGDARMEAMIRSLLGMSYLSLGKVDAAQSELDRAARGFRAAVGAQGGTDSLQDLASLLTSLGEAAGKIQQEIQALSETARQEPGQCPQIDQAHAAAFLDRLGESLREEIQILGREEQAPEFLLDFGLRNLKFLERWVSRDPEGSLREMDNVIAPLELWGKGLTLGELKTPFFNEFAPFYSMRVEMGTDRPEAAFAYAEQARARAFADRVGNQKIETAHGTDPALVREERRLRLHLNSLRKALFVEQKKPLTQQDPELITSLQDALDQTAKEHEAVRLRLKVTDPEYAALISVDVLSLSEVRGKILDEQTTLVEYFVPESLFSRDGSGQPLAWVIDRERFSMIPLPVSAGDLRNRVTVFRNLIESHESVQPLAAELYRDLFAPLAPYVRYRNLVIVPHGVLHFLPFAALWDGKRYLGDAYALSYSPSATALKFIRDKKAAVVGPILAAGDPDGSLEHAAMEARTVARRYATEPLLGSAATEGAVVSGAGQAGILHLAAHAVLNPVNPLFTRIELAPDDEHDGNLEMHEVYGLDLTKTGLVVLSACRTQMGRLTAGDEIEGLTRAFLYAGTPAVMSSLWSVEDESTAFLMERFYNHLRKGKGRAEALQRAQAETRKKFPHPYYWAAFVLTGDGR